VTPAVGRSAGLVFWGTEIDVISVMARTKGKTIDV
jgi:hypothetical protein